MRTLITMLGLTLPLCGCGDSPEAEEARRQISQAAERTGDYLAEQGRALRDSIADGLENMDERFADLDERAAAAGQEAQEKWRSLSREFSDEREILDQKLAEWKEASGEAAAGARREVETAWQNVRETWDRMNDEAGVSSSPLQ